jgi:transposase
MSQLHKRFTSDQVKELLERYLRNEIERKHLQEVLGIQERRFFALVRQYRENPHHFTIQYHRASPPRISEALQKNLLFELSIEKDIIQNKDVPLTSYNYSYIKDRLRKTYHQKVSLTTIIRRAKKHGFFLKKPQRSAHDREENSSMSKELKTPTSKVCTFQL